MTIEQAATKLDFDKVRDRILRYVCSDPGRELIGTLGFSRSNGEVRDELSRVSELRSLLEREGEFPIGGVFPVKMSVQKASIGGAILSPRELLQIASTTRAARIVRAFLSKHVDHHSLLWALADPLHTHKVLEFNIERAIDESEAVRANASKELQAIRRAIAEKYDQLRQHLERMLKRVSEHGFTQEDIITTREGRMVIPVKSEHKNKVPGFIHSTSASGATAFIEPTETLEMNNEITTLQFQERREVEKILGELSRQVGDARNAILIDLDIVAHLDALHAKAKYSMEILGIQPVVNEEGPIRIKQARHPVLMITHGLQQTVPMDMELGESFHTLVISGPNAGGKSVALKCVGLLCLMVQAGIHIPASDQTILRMFDAIFVDIGDEQSIENDLSTFSSHLANLKEILEKANGNSLVLIDEIGSGTDPAEGGAIAAAVLEALTARHAFTIATTHHGFLKVFANDAVGVENGAMEFDQSTLSPTYRLRSGVPGSSYALEMATRLNMDEGILRRSRDLLGSEQTKVEELIADLENSAQKYKKEMEEVFTERNRLGSLVREYEMKIASHEKDLRERRKQALIEAKQIIQQANAVIEESVRKIRESSGEKDTVKRAREDVRRFVEDLDHDPLSVQEESLQDATSIDVGSAVKMKSGGDPGIVESIATEKRLAYVVFGNVRMKVALKDLVPSNVGPKPALTGGVHGVEKPEVLIRDLDLRGMTGDEALPLIDKFIDSALLAGLNRIDIIHGKGTGALRKKVTDFLSKHPRVRSFRLGEWNEGGTGATVVELFE